MEGGLRFTAACHLLMIKKKKKKKKNTNHYSLLVFVCCLQIPLLLGNPECHIHQLNFCGYQHPNNQDLLFPEIYIKKKKKKKKKKKRKRKMNTMMYMVYFRGNSL